MRKTVAVFNSVIDFLIRNFRYYCLIILILAGFNLFYNLGAYPVNDWDEARHGVSAYEMVKNHNYIKVTFNGITEYWNLKPPLGIWLIAFSYKIFGINVFALRFPSAFAALLIIFMIIFLAQKLYGRKVAVFSGIILTTTFWFINFHAARTGDFDAQMALLVVSAMTCLLMMDKHIGYWYGLAFMISLAFLLKSFACFQMIGIIIVYLILTKKFTKIPIYHYLGFIAVALLPVFIWVFARFYTDGFVFFQRMVTYDLLQRSATALEGHQADMFFYFYSLLWGAFPWSLMIFIIPIFKLKYSKDNSRNFLNKLQYHSLLKNWFLITWLLVPLILFSMAQTKLAWYINPLYPCLAIIIGWLFTDILEFDFPKKRGIIIIFLVFLILAEIGSSFTAIFNKRVEDDQQILLSLKTTNKKTTLYSTGWSQSQIFITKVIKGFQPGNIPGIKKFSEISDGNALMMIVNNPPNLKSLKKHNLKIIAQNCSWLIIQKNNR